ncbi:MAG: hypothetical protein P0120_05435 [Nitrospira sp.]|nr:hypothetical protein [Nitrospira sp.]
MKKNIAASSKISDTSNNFSKHSGFHKKQGIIGQEMYVLQRYIEGNRNVGWHSSPRTVVAIK